MLREGRAANVPSEVLIQIFSWFLARDGHHRDHGSHIALLSIALTCRRWIPIGCELLYKRICLPSEHACHLLANTLAMTPSLGALVTSLCLPYAHRHDSAVCELDGSVPKFPWNVVQADAAFTIDHPDVVQVLKRCPNLTELTSMTQTYPRMPDDDVLEPSSYFARLKARVFPRLQQAPAAPPAAVIPALPSAYLTRLYLRGADCQTIGRLTFADFLCALTAPGCLRLEDLTLDHYHLDSSSIGDISGWIGQLSHLRRLCLIYTPIPMETFGPILSAVKTTLTALDFRATFSTSDYLRMASSIVAEGITELTLLSCSMSDPIDLSAMSAVRMFETQLPSPDWSLDLPVSPPPNVEVVKLPILAGDPFAHARSILTSLREWEARLIRLSAVQITAHAAAKDVGAWRIIAFCLASVFPNLKVTVEVRPSK